MSWLVSKLFVGILAILNKVGRNLDAGDELPDDVQMPLSGIAFDPEKINTRRPSGEHGAGTSRPLDQLRRTRFSRSFKTISYSFELGPCCSVAQSCPTLCDPVNRSTQGLPVHHQLPDLTQTPVHQISDAIQPSHPLSSPSPPALNLSQHQGLFK